jgi:hypothetical protein
MTASMTAKGSGGLVVTADTAETEAKLARLQRKLAVLDAQRVQDAWR